MPIVEYDRAKYKGSWKPNTHYDINDMVWEDNSLWVAKVSFQSSVAFNNSNWHCPDCNKDEFSLDPDSVTTATLESTVHVVYGKYADSQTGGEHAQVFGVNKHGDGGYYYMEFKISKFNEITGVRCGISWDTGIIGNVNNSLTVDFMTGSLYLNGTSHGSVTPWTNLEFGDILRVWVRNGKMWVGAKIGGVESVIGDPAADTGEVATFTPTNPLRSLISQLNISVVEYNAKSSDIECDPLGATPFED